MEEAHSLLDFWNRVNPHIILKSAWGQSCCHCLTLNTYCCALSFEERELGWHFIGSGVGEERRHCGVGFHRWSRRALTLLLGSADALVLLEFFNK